MELQLVLVVLSLLFSAGCLICWVITLVQIFTDYENGGVGKGVLAVICGLYALIWAWQNRPSPVVYVWSALLAGGILLNCMLQATTGEM